MIIKAKFKGSNSLGYENGKNYKLDIRMDSDHRGDFLTIQEITKMDSPGLYSLRRDSFCEYNSLRAFLNNWQVF